MEGLPSSIHGVIKAKNHSSLEEAIKDSIEEDKSNKGKQRLLYNKSNNSNSNKYCKNYRRNNHNTSECRYANRTVDTGQQYKQNKENQTRKPTCVYCKKTGHALEECYKKKMPMHEKKIRIIITNQQRRETTRNRAKLMFV